MKRLILILFCLFTFSIAADSAQSSKVWICTSSGAYAYHNNRGCSGLNNCRATIIQVSEQEAIEKWGRRKCKRCYGSGITTLAQAVKEYFLLVCK